MAIFKYFDQEHPLPPETAESDSSTPTEPKEITPEPARWGKGIGFGNVVGETEAQKLKKQQVAQQDVNMKALFLLFTKIVSEGSLKEYVPLDLPRC